jgi:pimeloyl-ACP methyl ester carboxylesterase
VIILYMDDHHPTWLVWKNVVVQGRRAAYGEAGSGPAVVFLHGWGLDHKAYKRALSRLVSAGVRVIAPALPGFGGTAAIEDTDCSISSYGSWVADFLEALGVEEPVLVMGHSFGGGVAIAFAHDHPHRARGLVLVNSIGASTWIRHGSIVHSMEQRPLWDWGLHFPADLWPLGQARRVLPVILAEALPNLRRDPLTFLRSARLARSADLTPQLEALKRRRLPMVVLWGTRDQIITRASFEEMCEVLGQPETVTVDGSHSWLIADPDAFGEVMTNVVDIASMARALPPTKRKKTGKIGTSVGDLRQTRRGGRQAS